MKKGPKKSINLIYKKLFYENRSLLGKGNKNALNILSRVIPIKYHSFTSGTKCFDWTIPQEWVFKKGILKDSKGKIIIDASKNILHILGYSASFRGWVNREELLKHLYYTKKLSGAIPYKTSYYAKNWGFCLSYIQFKKLKDSKYYVDIETKFKKGRLLIGEAHLKGKTNKQVILSSYTCHPLQANDGLSGVILLLLLYSLLKKKKLKYTYKFFFLPETIGSIALLAHKIIKPELIEYALVATCAGTGETINYKKTFQGNHSIDNIVTSILKNSRGKNKIKIRDYYPQGSDERQFSSPKIRIPTGSIMRIPYQEFPEYHTSQDSLKLVSPSLIKELAKIYYQVILGYEKYPKYEVITNGGEPFLTKYGLYRTISVSGHSTKEIMRSWVLFLADGTHNLKDISVKSGFSETELKPLIKELIKFKIIKEI